MIPKILSIKSFKDYLTAIVCLLLLLTAGSISCKKADQFYDTLQKLPQINYSRDHAYKAAYIIGDTMVITGRLQPENNLLISIGNVQSSIVKKEVIGYVDPHGESANMDKVYVLITAAMEGKAREVSVTSGGFTTTGTPVDIYSPGGPGSFTDSLKSVSVKTLPSGQNIFLYCVNGKGDIYYYSTINKDLRRIAKDGTEEILYDLSKTLEAGSSVLINTFLAGGVDPQGHYLYCSVRTNTGYRLLQLNLSSKQLISLNQSSTLGAPYEGNISDVKIIITGIYPDSQGNLYLAIGLGNNQLNSTTPAIFLPDAIARYNKADNKITYIYKGIMIGNVFPGMPGIKLEFTNSNLVTFRFSPEENLLYALEAGLNPNSGIIEVYNLTARIKTESLIAVPNASISAQYDAIAPFSNLQINMGTENGSNPDLCFGFLPMPGKRLQVLLYQFYAPADRPSSASNFPKWMIFDFADKRTYSYALGRFNQENHIFQPTGGLSPQILLRDELLNYDEDGHLYMTADGKKTIIKTQTVH